MFLGYSVAAVLYL